MTSASAMTLQLLDDAFVEEVHVLDGFDQTQLVQGATAPCGPTGPVVLSTGLPFRLQMLPFALLPLLFLLLSVSFHVCISAFDLEEDSIK